MSDLPAYAPTATTSYLPSAARAPAVFSETVDRSSVVLSTNHKIVYDSLAEMYSIVTALEVVENSFLKDYLTDKEKYTRAALRLIHQYEMLVKTFESDAGKKQMLQQIVGPVGPNCFKLHFLLESKFGLVAPLAASRLQSGIPATIEHLHTHVESSRDESAGQAAAGSGGASARLVAEATGNFITIMDALKLNYRTKEQLHPLLSELVVSLNDLMTKDAADSLRPIDFPGKSKMVSWLIRLNNMAADEEMGQDEIDQFLGELDAAYRGFYMSLE